MPPGNMVSLPRWEVLGSGESIAGNGGSQAAAVPPSAEIVHMAAEGGVAYYQFGDGIASALSSGFIPQNGRVVEGPLRDFGRNGMVMFAAVGVTLHIQYYRQNQGH